MHKNTIFGNPPNNLSPLAEFANCDRQSTRNFDLSVFFFFFFFFCADMFPYEDSEIVFDSPSICLSVPRENKSL